MKIALAVPGRFHAFDLGEALHKRGESVRLLTNYPPSVVEKFGFPAENVTSFLRHGLLLRTVGRFRVFEPSLHRVFGRWASRELQREHWDVIHCWSGVAEEILLNRSLASSYRLLMRGSSHIEAQARLMEDEEKRCGVRLDRPSLWMIEREKREYAMADGIRVLSSFAYRTFIESGVPASKLLLLPSGSPTEKFKASAEVTARRVRRIRSKAPLRVLYVGALSYRKGLYDLEKVIHELKDSFSFRLVGPVLSEAVASVHRLSRSVEVLPKMPQHRLPAVYAEADIFLFPTIEDGFAQVLSQARANGLPILTTPNNASLEIVAEEKNGWTVPIRRPDLLVEKLRWCDAHRDVLADRVLSDHAGAVRGWDQAAADFTAEVSRRSVRA